MLKTFKIGGVHPPENKLSAQGEIITLPLPEQVSIPLSQHIGAPAVPTVKKGDQVKVGQIIGQAAGFISANIHSSVSGTVMSLDPVIDASGYPRPAVTIKVEGDEWDENILKEPINKQPGTFTKEEILAAISAAGIVGMGGATFPTQVKLSPPPGSTAEVLIINGVECEPCPVDCVTVNPYLGTDGIQPFVNDCKTFDKAIFALVKTSNPSSGELQDLLVGDEHIYEKVAQCVNKWNEETIGKSGYGAVGAVVGATYPEQAKVLRKLMPKSYFLVPGYGAQGGGAEGVKPCFNEDGLGAIVNSSRGIMCAYKKGDWKEEQFAEAARAEAIRMKNDLTSVL